MLSPTEVKNAYKDVAGLYETDSLINNRPAFEKEVEALLKERLSTRGFTFTNIQSSVKPNDVLQAAIDEKNTAVQNALKVENEKKAAIAEAEKVVAAAKGKADANRILQQSITPELIQLKAVEKWDGKLPLSTGGNTLPFPEVAMTISMRPHWQLDSFGEVLIVCADNHK
ncbi:SPFH domain-containing protein [Bacteroides uniformis]|nr:SPFH domain-containing protein [Bacteroides uniformis]